MPENRTHSSPWLSFICFSPLTSAVPLGRTSAMVTESVEASVLVWAAFPPPLNDEFELALSASGFRKDSGPAVGGRIEAPPLLEFLELTDLAAVVFSISRIVTGSPTRAARVPV